MERVGMRREGAFRADSLHRDGRWLDSYAYGLLREEWVTAAR
jgi:RimJ/RimL family protein N-acetyltransferase